MEGVEKSNQQDNCDDGKKMVDDYFTDGVPSDDKVPHLHAITSRKMAVLQCPELLGYCGVDKDQLTEQLNDELQSNYIKQLSQDLKNASKKLLAIFKLIFKGDEVSSAFLLYNLLSKVHQRTPEGLAMGHFNLNISGVDQKQAYQIRIFLRQILAL